MPKKSILFKQKSANVISGLSHPLLTTSVLLLFLINFTELKMHTRVVYLIIGLNILPTLLWLYLKTKNGSYTNFDVSNRKQRNSLYAFMIFMMITSAYLLYQYNTLQIVFVGFVLGLLMVITSFFFNRYLKVSLHILINTYLIICLFIVNKPLFYILLTLMICVGWSRIFLNRHSLKEVAVGFVIGLVYGLLFLNQINF